MKRLSRMCRLRRFAWCMLSIALALPALAAEPKTGRRADAAATAEPAVVAKVGDQAVYAAEVDEILAGARRSAEGDDAARLRELALRQAINRRLAAQYLAKQGYTVDDEETKTLVADLKRKLEAQKLTFDDFLKRHRFNELIVRRRLQWDVMWGEYLKHAVTDEALEKFFDQHRREFDGTELRVSHILWRVKAGDSSALSAAAKQAEMVRAKLLAGQLSFADAAKQFSAGPSRRHGGDLGFIPAHDQMSESFSRAAFQLKTREVSEPVIDSFGVHLITCTEEKPGTRTWRDCRRELVAAFGREKFLELADEQRKRVDVKMLAE